METATAPLQDVFPPKPENVPPKLTAPSGKYRRHAWFAVAGLALFGIAYLGLIAWFGWSTVRLIKEAEDIFGLIWGGCSAILTLFLVKGLFLRNHPVEERAFKSLRKISPGCLILFTGLLMKPVLPVLTKSISAPVLMPASFMTSRSLISSFPRRKISTSVWGLPTC